jgi:hypothetical protein
VAYVLEAVVATPNVAGAFAARFPSARVVRLSEGLALVPLTESVINELSGGERWEWLLSDGRAPGPLATVLAEVSEFGPVAYFEAEFAGGGSQASVIWEGGQVVFGPIIEEDEGRRWRRTRRPLSEGAFNQALRRLGVRVGPEAIDEFETVGLDRCRMTEEWLDLAEPSSSER